MAGSFRGGLAQYHPRPEPSDEREFRYVVHLDVKSNPGTAVIAVVPDACLFFDSRMNAIEFNATMIAFSSAWTCS